MVDVRGENFVFWFSRTQENAFLDAFLRNYVFVPQMFFVQQKSEGAMAHPASQLCGPSISYAYHRASVITPSQNFQTSLYYLASHGRLFCYFPCHFDDSMVFLCIMSLCL